MFCVLVSFPGFEISSCFFRIQLELILEQLLILVVLAVILTLKEEKQKQPSPTNQSKLGYLLENRAENILPYIVNGNLKIYTAKAMKVFFQASYITLLSRESFESFSLSSNHEIIHFK